MTTLPEARVVRKLSLPLPERWRWYCPVCRLYGPWESHRGDAQGGADEHICITE